MFQLLCLPLLADVLAIHLSYLLLCLDYNNGIFYLCFNYPANAVHWSFSMPTFRENPENFYLIFFSPIFSLKKIVFVSVLTAGAV